MATASSLPHKSIKHSRLYESQLPVEVDGAMVRFCHRKRQRTEISIAQRIPGTSNEVLADAHTAILGDEAHLRYVSNVISYARTKNEPDQRVARPINGHERRIRIEHAAAGKAHDVVEKAHRAGIGAVLVVDFGVDVHAIRRRDNACRGLVILIDPAANKDPPRYWHGGDLRSADALQLQGQEKAAVALKSCRHERSSQVPRRMCQ